MPTTTGSLYSVELNICIKISKLVDVWTLLMLNSVKVIRKWKRKAEVQCQHCRNFPWNVCANPVQTPAMDDL
ncbi:Recombination protein RecR [Frankliniella fusca]|uniref:Recombination protein RecR n=1 Tax=Frankliniella fusca TaxID=407009 RepID=A0AAE1HJP7_9NEOP|nr:Recombination protein RecR [Frankliniella fusca]